MGSGYWEEEESVNNSHLGALYSVLPYSHSGIVGGTIRMFLLVTSLLCLVGGLRGAVTFPSTSDESPCVVLEQCCPLWHLRVGGGHPSLLMPWTASTTTWGRSASLYSLA